jgi:hypothetical protein
MAVYQDGISKTGCITKDHDFAFSRVLGCAEYDITQRFSLIIVEVSQIASLSAFQLISRI